MLTSVANPIDRAGAVFQARLTLMVVAADRLAAHAEEKGARMTPADDAQLEAVRRDLQRLGRDLERGLNAGLIKAGKPTRYTRSFWT
jgi:hypothetical protein